MSGVLQLLVHSFFRVFGESRVKCRKFRGQMKPLRGRTRAFGRRPCELPAGPACHTTCARVRQTEPPVLHAGATARTQGRGRGVSDGTRASAPVAEVARAAGGTCISASPSRISRPSTATRRFVSGDTLIGCLSHAAVKGRLESEFKPLHPHVQVIDELRLPLRMRRTYSIASSMSST